MYVFLVVFCLFSFIYIWFPATSTSTKDCVYLFKIIFSFVEHCVLMDNIIKPCHGLVCKTSVKFI